MLCKDCIHFDVCKDATVPNPEYKGVQPDKSKECRHFKYKANYAEMETLKNEIRQKETEVRDMASKMCLSEFSTTQLKAELRRRKRERQGYM